MSSFKVTLVSPDGAENVIQCPDDQYIVDAAEEAGIDIPYSCRSGGSFKRCTGRLVSLLRLIKRINHSSMMNRSKMDSLLCVSYPTSDVVVEIEQEENL